MSDRDVAADYKAALIEEFEAYKHGGRSDDADAVAAALRAQFDYEVAPKRKPSPERADVKAPEAAVPPKPQHRKETPESRTTDR